MYFAEGVGPRKEITYDVDAAPLPSTRHRDKLFGYSRARASLLLYISVCLFLRSRKTIFRRGTSGRVGYFRTSWMTPMRTWAEKERTFAEKLARSEINSSGQGDLGKSLFASGAHEDRRTQRNRRGRRSDQPKHRRYRSASPSVPNYHDGDIEDDTRKFRWRLKREAGSTSLSLSLSF